MSHEGVIYCKPHHKELFQPKAVRNDLLNAIDPNLSSGAAAHQKREQMEAAIAKHREQERRHETIIRENVPVQLDDVVKSCKANQEV